MALRKLSLLILACATVAPAEIGRSTKTADVPKLESDLKTDASTYYDRYADYGRGNPNSGYGGVTGYGSIDDRYSYGNDGYSGAGYGGSSGYSGYDGYRGGYGNQAYGNGYGGYGLSNIGASSGYGGYGGYGGYTGNGGLNSYYGYNNPNYQGYGHLGYGYYNKRPGYGNIYNSGITPSLVTGYRGYSRK